MKKKRAAKRTSKVNKKNLIKLEKEFISFGNRKKVFQNVTIATILITIAGIPIMIKDGAFLGNFLVIWILEIIYIAMYVKWGEKKRK